MTMLGYSTATISCDHDGHKGPPFYKIEVGVARSTNDGLREGGWLVSKDGKRHYCPDCRSTKVRVN